MSIVCSDGGVSNFQFVQTSDDYGVDLGEGGQCYFWWVGVAAGVAKAWLWCWWGIEPSGEGVA